MQLAKDPGQFFSTSPKSTYDFEACFLWNLSRKSASISTRLDYESKYFLLLSLPLNRVNTSAGTCSLPTKVEMTNNRTRKGKSHNNITSCGMKHTESKKWYPTRQNHFKIKPEIKNYETDVQRKIGSSRSSWLLDVLSLYPKNSRNYPRTISFGIVENFRLN